MNTTQEADPALIEDLVAANRILYDQGVVDGFGHVSVRHDKRPEHFLLARSMAPGLVTAADIMEFDRDGEAVDPQGRTPYLERFIHSEIFKIRPEVQAVVHSHSPSVIPFGVVAVGLQPIYHMSSFLGAGVPVFEIRDTGGPATDMLIRNTALGAGRRLDPRGRVPRGLHRGQCPAGRRRLAARPGPRHVSQRGGGKGVDRNQPSADRPPLGAVEGAGTGAVSGRKFPAGREIFVFALRYDPQMLGISRLWQV